MSERVQVMVAKPEHGPLIRDLIGANEWPGLESVDWTDLGGQWVMMLVDEAHAGCVQLLPGRPVGRIEHMGLAPWLSKRERAEVVSAAIAYGCGLLKLAGSQIVMTLVPHELEGYRRVLRRRGAVEVSDNRMMIKRLV